MTHASRNGTRAIAAAARDLVTRRLIENLIGSQPVTPSATILNGLTDREREVPRLMAAGLPNAEIAAELIIADATESSAGSSENLGSSD